MQPSNRIRKKEIEWMQRGRREEKCGREKEGERKKKERKKGGVRKEGEEERERDTQ